MGHDGPGVFEQGRRPRGRRRPGRDEGGIAAARLRDDQSRLGGKGEALGLSVVAIEARPLDSKPFERADVLAPETPAALTCGP